MSRRDGSGPLWDPMGAELRHHLEETVDRLVEAGWEPDAARREAERRLGNPERWRREADRAGGRGWTEQMRRLRDGLSQDLRSAMRMMRRSAGLSATVVFTLALGIGASLAILRLADAVLLNPVPVPEAERVLAVYQAVSEDELYGEVSYPMLTDLQEAGEDVFEGLAGHLTRDMALRLGETTARISVGLVSGNYFSVLGMPAAHGRTLAPEDDDPTVAPVAVLSHGFWERRFGSDPGAVGATIRLNGTSVEVVGVAPEGFRGTRLGVGPEVWVPLTQIRSLVTEGLMGMPFVLTTRAFPWIHMVGRLTSGATAVQAEEVLNGRARALRGELGDGSGVPPLERPVGTLPLNQAAAGERETLARFLGILGGVVLFALVVACLNAATLVSARGWSRDRELGIRQALGGTRARLTRQLLVENLVLAMMGGVGALLVAGGGLALLSAFTLPGNVDVRRLDLTVDGRMMGMALGISLVIAFFFGLAPALRGGTRELADRLRGGRWSTGGPGAGGVLLVAGQMGLSLVLLVGALLFGRTLQEALTTDLGFRSEGVAALSFGFRGQGRVDEEVPAALGLILDEAAAAPGVGAVAAASHVPLAPPRITLSPLPEGSTEGRGPVYVNTVTEGYFQLLGIEVVAGRGFTPADGPEDEDVVILSRAAARLFWPGEDPLGRTLRLLSGAPRLRVVGVAEDHHAHGVEDESLPYLFVPARQQTGMGIAAEVHLLARSSRSSAEALDALRQAVRSFDPALPTYDARVLHEQVDRVLMPQRLGALVLSLLAAVALLVSAVGVYGIVAFTVRRRTRDLGIRTALGAGRAVLLGELLRPTATGVAFGALAGLGVAASLSPFVEAWLYGIERFDPWAYVGATLLLAVAAALAVVPPAQRALAIDPRKAIEPEE